MDVEALIREDRREWAHLCEALDARPDGPLHDPESPEWNARDVYAHLARWIAHSTDDLESVLAGGSISIVDGADADINARWQAEDKSLTLAEARAKALQAFERRIRAIESVPADRWNPGLEAISHADDAKHYRAHRSWIRPPSLPAPLPRAGEGDWHPT
jgi:hypothetical protein